MNDLSDDNSSVEDIESLSTDGLTQQEINEKGKQFFGKERRAVRLVRFLVQLVLVVSGLLVSTATYIYTNNVAESNVIEKNIESSTYLLKDFEDRLKLEVISLDLLAHDLGWSGSQWSTVRHEDFEAIASRFNKMTKTVTTLLMPLITEETKDIWEEYSGRVNQTVEITKVIHSLKEDVDNEYYLPLWEIYPSPSSPALYNLDMLSLPGMSSAFENVITYKKAVFQYFNSVPTGNEVATSLIESFVTSPDPFAIVAYPIFTNGEIEGIIANMVSWNQNSPDGLHVELLCRETLVMCIDDLEVIIIGVDEPMKEATGNTRILEIFSNPSNSSLTQCQYSARVYEPRSLSQTFSSSDPVLYTVVVGLVFFFALLTFITYDCLIEHRHRIVSKKAVVSTAIVSSLFPENVRDRLLETSDSAVEKKDSVGFPDHTETSDNSKGYLREPAKLKLRNILRNEEKEPRDAFSLDKPIADFFPHCTVLFADIVGFTAWSSQREPAQVFILLQNIYHAFDKVARKLSVFKVETIGDSYVAVTGLPDPQEDHAVIMATFALQCRQKMKQVTRKLERTLGPETSHLSMRFGLHSGPVTAGVLRGERSRFQLFGDTVNTAARMESTGQRDRIQVSESTAKLLELFGKKNWVSPRDEAVAVKGKGSLQTFWLETKEMFGTRSSLGESLFESKRSLEETKVSEEVGLPHRRMPNAFQSMIWGLSQDEIETTAPTLRRYKSDDKTRLVDWNTEILLTLLKQVVAQRKANGASDESLSPNGIYEHGISSDNFTSLDEVTEIITLPNFDEMAMVSNNADPSMIELDEDVEQQLREYVGVVASMYRDNPFHNFEHACHVQMSMWKLLQRIVSPDELNYDGDSSKLASEAHKFTYGITSDPLTQFAVLFCALIHDVDHTGVTNGQLVKEQAHIAVAYKNKSVAEQNSVDLAWDLLMGQDYTDLRRCIFTNETDFKRFRQIVVNIVLATDIFDKELSALRKNRWEKAFDFENVEESPVDAANRKATIVLEHLMQASDVSHTMQHWEIYRKWNERLFYEMHAAFKSGRTDSDPSIGWYKGELWFFDNYVIPLAKKLKNCGVFGVCSDECLNYALENRRLWEINGEQIVADMVATDYFRHTTKKSKRRKNQLMMASLSNDDSL